MGDKTGQNTSFSRWGIACTGCDYSCTEYWYYFEWR